MEPTVVPVHGDLGDAPSWSDGDRPSHRSKSRASLEPTTTFGQYQDAVAVAMRQRRGLRKGQTFYNVLWELEPELAERLTGTADDPFYNDAKLPDFLARVAQTLR